MLTELLLAAHKLEAHNVLNIATKIIIEVADTIELAEKLGIKVDWTDRIQARLIKRRDIVN